MHWTPSMDRASVATFAAVSFSVVAIAATAVFASRICDDLNVFLDDTINEFKRAQVSTDDAWNEIMHEKRGGQRSEFINFAHRARRSDVPSHCNCIAQHVCPQGPPGEPGRNGEDGRSGPPGRRGNNGVAGMKLAHDMIHDGSCIQCPAGPPGKSGPPGLAGLPGPRGEDGDPGTPGKDGLPGSSGPTGDIGRPGVPGVPGRMGRPGSNGVRSIPGPAGPPGLPGPPGPPGPTGPAGVAEEGPDGLPGSAGPPGKPGMPGPMGQPGPSGQPGIPGIDGAYCPCPAREQQLLVESTSESTFVESAAIEREEPNEQEYKANSEKTKKSVQSVPEPGPLPVQSNVGEEQTYEMRFPPNLFVFN